MRLLAGAEEVRLAGDEGEQFVFIALDEEAERLGVADVRSVFELSLFLFPARDDQPQAVELGENRRVEEAVAVVAFVVIRRDEASKHRHEVKHREDDTAHHRRPARAEALPEKLAGRERGVGGWNAHSFNRIRGSLHASITSATKFPTMSSAVAITTESTTSIESFAV